MELVWRKRVSCLIAMMMPQIRRSRVTNGASRLPNRLNVAVDGDRTVNV